MLILTRRVGESVVIHDEVYCTIVGYKNGRVRLAFDAPKSVAVHREEIQDRINCDSKNRYWPISHLSEKECVVDRLIDKFKNNRI